MADIIVTIVLLSNAVSIEDDELIQAIRIFFMSFIFFLRLIGISVMETYAPQAGGFADLSERELPV